MSTNIVPFEYAGREVRTLTIEGEPWFVLADLCRVLDIANARNVAARLGDDQKGVRLLDTLGGRQNLTVVNEAGMYEVVLRSDKPEAVSFRRWITGTVLPEIRKTGSFGGQLALTDEQIVAQALQITTRKVEALEAKISEDAPKVEYHDTFVADEDLRLFRNVAKSIGMGETDLREALIAHGWIYREQTSRYSHSEGQKVPYVRYSSYAHKADYFRPVPNHDAPRFKGEVMHTLKITPSGAHAIARAVRQWFEGEEVAA